MGRIAVILVAVICAPILIAQQLPLRFEVASVKPSPDPRSVPVFSPVVGEIRPGGFWRSTFATVFGLISTLYPDYFLPGQIEGPPWINTEFFDINGRAAPSATPDQIREMARTLLADRFKLMMHTEQREVPAYTLTIGRSDGRLGPGLMKPAIDCDAYRAAKARGEQPLTDPTRKPIGDRLPCVSTVMPLYEASRVIPGANLRITAGGATITSIIAILSRELRRPVVDATGLTQTFDIEVQYSQGPPLPDKETGPPLRAAIADQLGLRLQDGRTSIDVLVIDSVDRPTPD
jgi:uncharacterized protein (TIGR03435 family)